MKRLILLGLLLLGTTIQLHAQLMLGAKAGLNVNSRTQSEYHTGVTASPGIQLGVDARYPLSDVYSVHSGFYLSQKGYITNVDFFNPVTDVTTSVFTKSTFNYLELPVDFVYKVVDNLYVHGGAYFSFSTGGKYFYKSEGGNNFEDTQKFKPTTGKVEREEYDTASEIPMNFFDAGINVGIGYEINEFMITANYSTGLVPVLKNFDDDPITLQLDEYPKNRTFTLSVAYYFAEFDIF